jgi:prepilin-type N-terminal cleavage/methylation domain-containing protein
MRARNIRGPAGFTLVETLVAVSILGIVVASISTAYSFGFGVTRASQEDLRADQILLQKLEMLRVYNLSQTCSNGFVPATFQDSFAPGAAQPGVTYTGSISISNAPLTELYASQLRQVTVTLNWNSASRPCRRRMTTLVAQHGIQTYKT